VINGESLKVLYRVYFSDEKKERKKPFQIILEGSGEGGKTIYIKRLSADVGIEGQVRVYASIPLV
jgi:ribosomal protein L19